MCVCVCICPKELSNENYVFESSAISLQDELEGPLRQGSQGGGSTRVSIC